MAKRKLFDKPTDYVILAFIIGLVSMLAFCEDANAADYAVEISHDSNAGTTDFNNGLDRLCGRAIFETGTSFVFCPVVAVGGDINKDSFELGIADELWDRWEGQITLNRYDGVMDGGVTVRRIVGDDDFQMFIGGSYWIDQSPGSNSNFTFNLGLRYTF